jgi:L-lactate dehydrogenase
VTIGNVPLAEFCDQWEICLDDEDKNKIEHQVRDAAYQIIQGKGATYYGVSSAISKIVEVILGDQRAILTVCAHQPEVLGVEDITLSLPHLVGGSGVLKVLQVPLTREEEQQLKKGALVIQSAIQELDSRS